MRRKILKHNKKGNVSKDKIREIVNKMFENKSDMERVVDKIEKYIKKIEERMKDVSNELDIEYDYSLKKISSPPLSLHIDLSNIRRYYYYVGKLEGLELALKILRNLENRKDDKHHAIEEEEGD